MPAVGAGSLDGVFPGLFLADPQYKGLYTQTHRKFIFKVTFTWAYTYTHMVFMMLRENGPWLA